MIKAALLVDFDAPLEIVDLEVRDLEEGEVRVRLVSASVCGSDQGHIEWGWGPTPIVLGHEGAGRVVAVGAAVDSVKVDDSVVLASCHQCGDCFYCRRNQRFLCTSNGIEKLITARRAGTDWRALPEDTLEPVRSSYHWNGEPVSRFYWSGTLAEEVVVPERALVRIDAAMPLELASLLGCAVITGTGAALNAADIQQGDTVAVVGCGGVGLNAVQGARIAGAERIIAVDVNASRLELARTFGATDVVDGSTVDAVEDVRSLTSGRGADVTLEAVHALHGGAAATKQALELTRNGGQLVMIGGAGLELPINFIVHGMRVVGSLFGSADLRTEFERLSRLYLEGQLLLDELATTRLPIEQANDAFAAMRSGDGARSLIVY